MVATLGLKTKARLLSREIEQAGRLLYEKSQARSDMKARTTPNNVFALNAPR
jgi:hypothetical protein